MERILSKLGFADRLTVSESTLERRETEALLTADTTFPRRRRLGAGRAGRVGYLESEVDRYLRSLPTGALVERTAAARAKRSAKRLDGHGAAAEARRA